MWNVDIHLFIYFGLFLIIIVYVKMIKGNLDEIITKGVFT